MSTMEDAIGFASHLETSRNILSLSDEILVHICSYLASEDLVSLSSTCKRLNDILCERKLVRCMNLKAVYSLTSDLLKSFLKPHLRCKNVQVLSLASCYWLNSSDLLWAVLRLTNLKSLHVNDTNLSLEHLTRILNSIKSIESLSWTFHVTEKINAPNIKKLSRQLQSIKFFNLWTKGFAVSFLPLLLKDCSSLEELKLSTYKFRDVPWEQTQLVNINVEITLPRIKSLIVNIPEGINYGWYALLRKYFAQVFKENNRWNCLWLDTRLDLSRHILSTASRTFIFRNCSDLYAVSMDFQDDEYLSLLMTRPLEYFKYGCVTYQINFEMLLKITRITCMQWRNEAIPSILPLGLKHLCIECHKRRRMSDSRTIISYKDLPQLFRLSVPACMFLSHSSVTTYRLPEEEETFLKKQSRQSHLKNQADADCLLREFTEYAPNVQELEVKCKSGCSILTQHELASFVIISNWTQLESLFLQNVPLIDLSGLVTVCTACPKLRRFGIKNIGMAAGLSQVWKLVQAISLLQNLEDFQFEHPVVDNLMIIIEALSKRSKLRRVSIICEKTTVPQNTLSYVHLLEKCSLMVFLFVRVASISQKMSKDFQKELKTKFLNNRKSLWASIEGTYNDDFWEAIPTIHCYEMISDPALLTIIPPLKG